MLRFKTWNIESAHEGVDLISLDKEKSPNVTVWTWDKDQEEFDPDGWIDLYLPKGMPLTFQNVKDELILHFGTEDIEIIEKF